MQSAEWSRPLHPCLTQSQGAGCPEKGMTSGRMPFCSWSRSWRSHKPGLCCPLSQLPRGIWAQILMSTTVNLGQSSQFPSPKGLWSTSYLKEGDSENWDGGWPSKGLRLGWEAAGNVGRQIGPVASRWMPCEGAAPSRHWTSETERILKPA